MRIVRFTCFKVYGVIRKSYPVFKFEIAAVGVQKGFWQSSLLLCVMKLFFLAEPVFDLKFPKVKVVFQQCAVRQSEFAVIDRQPITCLSSAKQQFVQLVLYPFVVSSTEFHSTLIWSQAYRKGQN